MADLALIHLSYAHILSVQFRLVHLSLVDLAHLSWGHLGGVDRGVFDCVCGLAERALSGLIHLVLIRLSKMHLLPVLGNRRCAPLPLIKRSTAIDVLFVDLDETTVGTRDPVPGRQDIDILNREDFGVIVVCVSLSRDVFFNLLVHDGLDYLLGHG